MLPDHHPWGWIAVYKEIKPEDRGHPCRPARVIKPGHYVDVTASGEDQDEDLCERRAPNAWSHHRLYRKRRRTSERGPDTAQLRTCVGRRVATMKTLSPSSQTDESPGCRHKILRRKVCRDVRGPGPPPSWRTLARTFI